MPGTQAGETPHGVHQGVPWFIPVKDEGAPGPSGAGLQGSDPELADAPGHAQAGEHCCRERALSPLWKAQEWLPLMVQGE